MKKLTIIIAALALAGVIATSTAIVANSTHSQNRKCTAKIERGYMFDGMFFSTANIVDYHYYGNEPIGSDQNAYYVTYDDIDAGMDMEEIRVSADLYQIAIDYAETGESVYGTLRAERPNETVIYELIPELD